MGRVAVAVIVSLWVIPISLLVNHIVSESYMDEIFHIPQAQQYCKGNFRSWDPMITTPPGLYYLSLGHVASLFPGMWCAKAVSTFSEICSPAILRSVNGVLAVICSLLIYEILTQSRPSLSEGKATLISVVLSLYPLHWFFTFLYYTDVASLAAVLAMYLACLKHHYQLSAMIGVLAILIRQTNIVWMLLVACSGVIEFLFLQNCKDVANCDNKDISRRDDVVDHRNSTKHGQSIRKRKMDRPSTRINHSASKVGVFPRSQASGLLDEVWDILTRLWHLKWEVLVLFGPYFLVLAGFVSFVLWNGSIVLGAKEAHTVSPHFAQIMYFGLFSALAMSPFYFGFDQASDLCLSLWKNKLMSFFQISIGLTSGFLFVHFFSIAHPYLLADNRHYTFYIWCKVINSYWQMKYLLVPLYIYSWFSIFSILGKVQKKIWLLVFFLACVAVLVPAPLIEFRYYTIPFYFVVLHSQVFNERCWLLVGVLYTAVNVFTMLMFLFRPFHWNHVPGTQRFIW